jgi:predicted LPLAT superfamily acyltransferase
MKKTWHGASRGSALGNRIFMHLVRAGGPFCAYPLLAGVACQYARCNKPFRDAVRALHVRLGAPARFRDYYAHAFAYGMGLVDGLAVHVRRQTPFRLRWEGRAYADEAFARGRGLIILSAHIGNWEFAGRFLAAEVERKVNLVMLDEERAEIKAALRDATRRRNAAVIAMDDTGMNAVVEIRAALARNEIVCMLGDRSIDPRTSCAVDFLGAPALFPNGPFAVAAITGASILPTFTLKTGPRTYTIILHPSFVFSGTGRDSRESWMRESMRAYVRAFEGLVRRFPYQWGNFYDFWAR